jgi:hypothetical protein
MAQMSKPDAEDRELSDLNEGVDGLGMLALCWSPNLDWPRLIGRAIKTLSRRPG